MNKADYPGEFAVNRAYSSGAVTSAPSPHDTGMKLMIGISHSLR